MEEKSFQFVLFFTGLFLCLLHTKGVSSNCNDIRRVDFAEITYEPEGIAPYPEGTVASIECSYFYQIVPRDFQNRTCTNGSWTGVLPRCRHTPRFCHRHSGLIEIYGRHCQTPCRNRLEACPGNKRCICDGVCGWSCISIYEENFCPEVPEQAGLLVTYDPPERHFSGTANFSCSEGYTPNELGSQRLRCMSNRQWGGGNPFLCIPNTVCEDPPSVDRASLQSSDQPFFLPGDTRSYSCNLGYTTRGYRLITCGENYEWSEPEFTCRPISCSYPGTIPNADLTTRVFQFPNRAIYVCREGYENPPYTLNYRTCQANGAWSEIIPTCEPIRCPEIVEIANGIVDSWGNTFDSHVRFECNNGYRLDGSPRRVCQGDKTWSGQETVCTEIICEDQGPLVNGYKTNEKPVYRLNDVIYFHCHDGFTRDGEQLSYCTESGEWAHPMPTCNEPCTIPSHPRDGRWLISNLSPGTSTVNHNTRLNFRCNTWRFSKRLNYVRCNNGVWSDSDASQRLCQGIPCNVRGSADMALDITYYPPLSNDDPFNHQIPHDTRVQYSCPRGFSRQGIAQTRCWHGHYDHDMPSCEPVPCQEDEVSNGWFVYRTPNGGKQKQPHHGDTRILKCHSTYTPMSFNRSECDIGQWINEGSQDFRCEPKPCDPIPETTGSIHYSAPPQENGKYIHGTVVNVNCHANNVPAFGDGTAVCNASMWWKVVPTCLESPNVIYHSVTSQSPSKRGLIDRAWLARDGRTESREAYCTRTKRIINPWWKAVLSEIYNITLVKIYNRLDRRGRRYDLVGAEVRIGINENDYTVNPLCGRPITRQQVESSTEANHGIAISCAGIPGNVISVHIPVNEERELSLCEVEVYEQGIPISVNGTREGSQVGCIVPVVENAEVTSSGIAVHQVLLAGREARFSCDAFYDLRDSDVRHVDLHCLSNSSWDKSQPVCEPQTCRVNWLFHGYYPGNKFTYDQDENITFFCNNGYEKESDQRYWCDRTVVIPRRPACIPASCSVPNLGDHMSSLESHFSHDTFLHVSCERGFELSTNQTLPRCVRGEWDGPLGVTCQRVRCGEPVRASQSTIELLPGEVQDYVHGARVRYSCSDGWEIEGLAERVCNNGQWTGSTPECIVPAPVPCMLPDRLRGERYYVTGYFGNIFDDGLPIGEEVDIAVRCDPGYLAQSQVQTSCLEGGVWSVPVPICVRMERLCSKPGYIFRVRQYVNGEETNEIGRYPHDELPEGTFLVSRCSDPGEYVLHGSANRTCYDGSWTGQEPSCAQAGTRITFRNNQPLQIRSDGTIVILTRSWLHIDCSVPSNKVPSLESESGLEGYFLNGGYNIWTLRVALHPPQVSHSGHLTCKSRDNSVSHSVNIQFRAIYCAPPRALVNGQTQDYDIGWKHGRYFMGKEISFTCNDGYFLVGQRRITCVLGSWSHPTPACQRATCEELHAPAHGSIMGGNRVGESVLVGCNRGYQIQGELFLDCLESGQWSHPMPTCVQIDQPERPCDSVTCEVWQKCETDRNGVGVCRCISALDCPVGDEPAVVCGTDGRNYTNLCQLKALSCLHNNGVEEASNSTSCILGIPEREPTLPPIVYEEPSMSSSFDTYPAVISHVSETQEVPSANEGSVEPGRPHLFCHANECPTRSGAELCQDATAIVIAYPDEWNEQLGIMRITIYDVMMGDLPSWTPESSQDILIDTSAASSRGCVCPSFEASDPVIIRFSQNLTAEGMGQLLYSDIVLLYSQQLFVEITECMQEPAHVTSPNELPQDGSSSSSFSSLGDKSDQSPSSYESVGITPTASTSRGSVVEPTDSVESSYESAV